MQRDYSCSDIFHHRDPQELGRLAWLSNIDEKHKVSQALIFNASATIRKRLRPKKEHNNHISFHFAIPVRLAGLPMQRIPS